jgi:hypothetical protein
VSPGPCPAFEQVQYSLRLLVVHCNSLCSALCQLLYVATHSAFDSLGRHVVLVVSQVGDDCLHAALCVCCVLDCLYCSYGRGSDSRLTSMGGLCLFAVCLQARVIAVAGYRGKSV